jgi:hypothetical protein
MLDQRGYQERLFRHQPAHPILRLGQHRLVLK